MTDEIRFCKNCKYFLPNDYLDLCRRFPVPDLVNGGFLERERSAREMREDEAYCGFRAKRFTPKEAT